MNAFSIGIVLKRTRLRAGLTQAEVAACMGTSQSVIARAESGGALPSLKFVDRFAKATGERISLEFNPKASRISERERRTRVRRATENFVFDPWARNPSGAEAKSLVADGLTRERFKSNKPA